MKEVLCTQCGGFVAHTATSSTSINYCRCGFTTDQDYLKDIVRLLKKIAGERDDINVKE